MLKIIYISRNLKPHLIILVDLQINLKGLKDLLLIVCEAKLKELFNERAL